MSASTCACPCSPPGPIAALREEHRLIELVLDAAERTAMDAEIDDVFFDQALDFFRNFTDGCHHAKEEQELFPRLQRAGAADGGPIASMLHEHRQGRALLKQMSAALRPAAAGEPTAAAAFRAALANYIGLLRQHIWKEDHMLLAAAERRLSAAQRRELDDAIQRFQARAGEPGARERYARLARRLYRRTLPAPLIGSPS